MQLDGIILRLVGADGIILKSYGEIFSTGPFYRGRTLLAVTIAVHTDVTCRKVALPCQ
jgi:hypothetical protein